MKGQDGTQRARVPGEGAEKGNLGEHKASLLPGPGFALCVTPTSNPHKRFHETGGSDVSSFL